MSLWGAACSSGSDESGGTTTTTTTTTTSESTSSTTAPSTSTSRGATTSTNGGGGPSTTPGTPGCATSQLEAELGQTNAGAGQIYQPLVLRNTSSSTCTVKGFPGVSLLDGSGTQLGQPATREGNEGGEVRLAAGGVASATLHTTNQGIGGQACTPPSAQVKVFPPDQTAALTISAQYTACGGFTVTTLAPGDTGVA